MYACTPQAFTERLWAHLTGPVSAPAASSIDARGDDTIESSGLVLTKEGLIPAAEAVKLESVQYDEHATLVQDIRRCV